MRVFAMVLLAGVMFGCAPQTVPLPEESARECERLAKMTERVYVDKRREDLLNAAIRLFDLTGGGYAVTRTEDGLTAQRMWHPVEPGKGVPHDGSDTWILKVTAVRGCNELGGGFVVPVEADHVHGTTEPVCNPGGPGIKLYVYHIPEIYSQGLMPTECLSAPLSKPATSRFTVTPALYELFFMRMDYLLGKSRNWPTCAGMREDVRNNVYYQDQFSTLNFRGHLDGLCVQVEDRRP